MLKDIQRVFGFHGAEHKTINAYENDLELTVENVKKSSRLHPRCGTSFIFIVILISLFVFPLISQLMLLIPGFIDLKNITFLNLGKITMKALFILSHIIFGLPLISSISYELLKLSGKYKNNFLVKILTLPGLFFQLFTTREPDETMITIGIRSLKLLLEENE